MKLMVLSTLYAPHQVGGAEKVAQLLAEGLTTLGHECAVVTTRPRPGLESTRVNGVPVHAIGMRNVYWPFRQQRVAPWLKLAWHVVNRYNPSMGRAVGRLLDQERPDVLHTHSLTGFSPSVWAAARSRSIPIVHTLHDYSLACPKASMFRNDGNCERSCTDCRLLTAPARRHSRALDAVVGVSHFTLQRHLELGYFPSTPIRRVIHNGLPGWAGAPHRAAAIPDRLRLGYAGRLVRPKGIDLLVQVMQAFDASACELLVAGKGTEEEERQLRALAPANVRFLGFIDADELYRRIDVLVVPSVWQDPLPTTAIEAMRHGVPAIVSNRGGLPEIVIDGQTGRVFRAEDPGALRSAIEEFVRQPGRARSMTAAVLARANHFRTERMAQDYSAVLDAVVAARRTRVPRAVGFASPSDSARPG